LVDAIGGTIDEIIKIQNEQLLKEKEDVNKNA